jgi:hypothetical protein
MDSKLTFSFFSSRAAFLQNLKNQIMTTNLVIMLSRHTLSCNFGGRSDGRTKTFRECEKASINVGSVCAINLEYEVEIIDGLPFLIPLIVSLAHSRYFLRDRFTFDKTHKN